MFNKTITKENFLKIVYSIQPMFIDENKDKKLIEEGKILPYKFFVHRIERILKTNTYQPLEDITIEQFMTEYGINNYSDLADQLFSLVVDKEYLMDQRVEFLASIEFSLILDQVKGKISHFHANFLKKILNDFYRGFNVDTQIIINIMYKKLLNTNFEKNAFLKAMLNSTNNRTVKDIYAGITKRVIELQNESLNNYNNSILHIFESTYKKNGEELNNKSKNAFLKTLSDYNDKYDIAGIKLNLIARMQNKKYFEAFADGENVVDLIESTDIKRPVEYREDFLDFSDNAISELMKLCNICEVNSLFLRNDESTLIM